METKLSYEVDLNYLEQGNFQYYYSLLSGDETEVLEVFLPLDTKDLWDPKDKTFLAVAKFSYLLPLGLGDIDETKFTDKDYLQRTLPRYEVTRQGEGFHVSDTFLTPDFDVTLSFLGPDHPDVSKIPLIDQKKLREGKIKVTFMHQENFGRVLFFKTAKFASAMIIYEEVVPKKTLVTQYILSNIINVPTKEMIRKGMLENLQDVVEGSRSWANDQK